jgi:anti-anti-sigma regulatory factor
MIIALPEELTISHLAALKAKLVTSLNKHDSLQLDASATTTVDIAGLQLLCATYQAARAHKKSISLAPNTPTQVIREAMDLAGFGIHNDCLACHSWKEAQHG